MVQETQAERILTQTVARLDGHSQTLFTVKKQHINTNETIYEGILMTDEDRIIELMNEQGRLNSEIAHLADQPSRKAHQQVEELRREHSEVVRELIELVDGPLRAAFAGSRRQMENAGVQYTEMVHDFFAKLLERKVRVGDPIRSFDDIRKLVATVLRNQVRDYLRVEGRRREILEDSVAPLVRQRQQYWDERYQVDFRDAMLELATWETSSDKELRLAAEALTLRYIVGERWAEIATQLGISDERLNQLRTKAGKQFRSVGRDC